MRTLLRFRIILLLTALAVGPALLLDLFAVGPDAGALWSAVGITASWLGFPYYAAQLALGLAAKSPSGPPSTALDIAAALLVTGVGIAAHVALRWYSRQPRPTLGAPAS